MTRRVSAAGTGAHRNWSRKLFPNDLGQLFVVDGGNSYYRDDVDRAKRYTVNAGVFSGNNFIGSWDNSGLGINDGDYHSHYVKQFFFSATPVIGLEAQVGGIYPLRGEATEFTTFDDDGYLMGERLSVRRPKALYVDELSVTRALLGPSNEPNLFDRFERWSDPNYMQVLATKRFSSVVAGSADYTRLAGADTLYFGISLRFQPTAVVTGLRYEQYYRFNATEASGFAVTVERPIARGARVQGGYATVDERYGNLNADRIQRGRRFFAIGTLPLRGPLSAGFYVTQALHSP